MREYMVTISYIIRPTDSTTSAVATLAVRRYANSGASAIASVSSLFGALSNFAWATGTNAGLKYLEIAEVSSAEVINV